MHHSGGAASETIYIYKNVIRQAFSCLPECHVMVVGLGLAYIEISWAIEVLNASTDVSGRYASYLISYEKDEELGNEFFKWLKGESNNNETYDSIYKMLGGLDHQHLNTKSILLENYREHPLRGALESGCQVVEPFNVICFDAFSSKTNTHLWSDDFLNEFLDRFCAKDCVFTTYACTGILKRALIQKGFTFIKRPGFTGKRDSTLALRGNFATFEKLFRTF